MSDRVILAGAVEVPSTSQAAAIERFGALLAALAEEFAGEVHTEPFPATGMAEFLKGMPAASRIILDRHAQHKQLGIGDTVRWWDADDGQFYERTIVAIHEDGDGKLSFDVEGRDAPVVEAAIAIADDGSPLWGLGVGDELEWWCTPLGERTTPPGHAPDDACAGGVWHRARITQVLHEGRNAPGFRVEGCWFWLHRNSAETVIRVPGIQQGEE